MIAAPWEKSNICELDITSTELSAECLEHFLTRIPYFTYLAVGHSDFFGDQVFSNDVYFTMDRVVQSCAS